ncbi:uncharacterized protein BO80DRAFT_442305 [Aspergillus ibericus CBS 121593]|uniref:Uncharacterized protein n=1 Tax=Aspergillus ibericus CBS 121593 TaxID=1448316 RepID=A0A395H886_9EURO|nr:hypothetical protein BO80DRAFT_442305 [Aspergillus ibericus CBS 121593]RAL03723.1 hypothetical protein BO80DRAFT_442305 [Aspergillus ibericus CBS 121593]
MSFLARLENATRWFPVGTSKEERSLVRKLDWLVLPYACLSFFVKYLDVSALTNAYVSGMKEDLDLYGNRLNYINAAFPSNLVLIKYAAQYYLPFAEIFWGLFTLGTAFVKNYQPLVVMRFFVSLSATSAYVGPQASSSSPTCPDAPNPDSSPRAKRPLAIKRLSEEGFTPSTGLNRSILKRLLFNWKPYAFKFALGDSSLYKKVGDFVSSLANDHIFADIHSGLLNPDDVVDNIKTISTVFAYTQLEHHQPETADFREYVCLFDRMTGKRTFRDHEESDSEPVQKRQAPELADDTEEEL